jgi:hypothetical protein
MQKFLIWSFGMWPSEVLPSLLNTNWLTAQTLIGEVKEHVGIVEKAKFVFYQNFTEMHG